MKKQYIKPETMVELLEAEVMMLTQSNPLYEDSGSESLSNGRNNRRGTWGNLWYTEQE